MLGKIEKLVTPLIRQPEQTDTHQYIRQHERESNKRKNNSNKQDDFDNNSEDQATVSIESVILFLENMMINSGIPANNIHSKASNNAGFNKAKEVKPSLYAANAYAHAAKTSPVIQELNSNDHNIEANIQKQGTNNVIVREIYDALVDLKKRGATTLIIERSDTFLNSLLASIHNAQASL